MRRSIITGSGSYIPEVVVKNSDFSGSTFYSVDGGLLDSPTDEIITKFSKITGIVERRYSAPASTGLECRGTSLTFTSMAT